MTQSALEKEKCVRDIKRRNGESWEYRIARTTLWLDLNTNIQYVESCLSFPVCSDHILTFAAFVYLRLLAIPNTTATASPYNTEVLQALTKWDERIMLLTCFFALLGGYCLF